MTHFRKNKQIDMYIFPPSTVNGMKKSIHKTEKSNKEHAFSLCLDEETNEVHVGKEHVDEKNSGSIKFKSECKKKNHNPIGTFHTHVNTDSSEASALDIHNNCQEYNRIDCIGSAKDGRIICMTKINPENCQHKVERLVKEEDVLIETHQGNEDKLYDSLDRMIKENFKLSELE